MVSGEEYTGVTCLGIRKTFTPGSLVGRVSWSTYSGVVPYGGGQRITLMGPKKSGWFPPPVVYGVASCPTMCSGIGYFSPSTSSWGGVHAIRRFLFRRGRISAFTPIPAAGARRADSIVPN